MGVRPTGQALHLSHRSVATYLHDVNGPGGTTVRYEEQVFVVGQPDGVRIEVQGVVSANNSDWFLAAICRYHHDTAWLDVAEDVVSAPLLGAGRVGDATAIG